MAEEKTNVMRLLEQKKIPFTPHHYDASDGAVDGVTVAVCTTSKTFLNQGTFFLPYRPTH